MLGQLAETLRVAQVAGGSQTPAAAAAELAPDLAEEELQQVLAVDTRGSHKEGKWVLFGVEVMPAGHTISTGPTET